MKFTITRTRLFLHLLLCKAGELPLAKRFLWDEQLKEVVSLLGGEQQLVYRQLRSRLLFDLAEYRASVQELLNISKLEGLLPEDIISNQEALWLTLMEIPLVELSNLSNSAKDRLSEGWYQLASLSKSNQTNLSRQLMAVEEWGALWPDHPASLNLPADLQLLKQLAEEQPQHIALILPLEGKLAKASEAIRDGFMSAYYQNTQQDGFTPLLSIFDSSNANVSILYNQAIEKGVELIIGPLQKEVITELVEDEELVIDIPVLALNEINTIPLENSKIYQFGLTIEDEAIQIAEQAWRDGKRKAMVIAPQNAWGDRGVEAFTHAWTETGGELSYHYRYTDQRSFSPLIKDAMHVVKSNERAKVIRNTLGVRIEFEPRRREDIDFIFLVANAPNARQLNPTFAFHYAGDIPVYAVSNVYDGNQDFRLNRDMNGIRFTTLPWYFESRFAEKKEIDQFNSKSNAYSRLYALGVDAFYIYPRLKQLATLSNTQYYGATGALSMNTANQIKRRQHWAEFKSGKAQPVGTAEIQ